MPKKSQEQQQLDLGLGIGDQAVCSAVFSPDRRHRYELWRRWGEGAYCAFICLNPSTADELEDDPTVRRCIRFSKAWGYDAFCMLNIFGYRATDPADMKKETDPVGPGNNETLIRVAEGAGIVIAAWGIHGTHNNRAAWVMENIPNLNCLGLTQEGHPRHPLYLKKTSKPFPFEKQDTIRATGCAQRPPNKLG